MNIAQYQTMIDPATFDQIARHLRSRLSPIEFVLHVRDDAMLAPLAEELETVLMEGRCSPREIPRFLSLVQDGSLRLSSRLPIDIDPRYTVDPATVPLRAGCRVLYMPPFYLVHTPGLFEGTLVRESAGHRPRVNQGQTRSNGLKP